MVFARTLLCHLFLGFLWTLLLACLPVACKYQPPGIPEGAKKIHASFWQKKTSDVLYIYYPDGKLYQKGHLKNGLRHGVWQYFSHDGQATTFGYYQNGLRIKKWIFLNSSGGLYQELHYAPEPKRLDYLLLSGNQVGNENGPYRRYYEDGGLEEEGFYRGGSKHGMFQRYYPNGRLESRGAYKKDLREGPWLYYYPTGRPKRQESYQAGKLTGKLLNYYPDGSLYNQSLYENGVRKGEVRLFAKKTALQTLKGTPKNGSTRRQDSSESARRAPSNMKTPHRRIIFRGALNSVAK